MSELLVVGTLPPCGPTQADAESSGTKRRRRSRYVTREATTLIREGYLHVGLPLRVVERVVRGVSAGVVRQQKPGPHHKPAQHLVFGQSVDGELRVVAPRRWRTGVAHRE